MTSKINFSLQSALVNGEDQVMASPKLPKLSPQPESYDNKARNDEEEGEITEEDHDEEEAEDILLLNDPLDKLT